MRYLRRLLVISAVALLWLVGWNAYSDYSAGSKIGPELVAAAEAGRPVDVEVWLNFPPEQFHLQVLQEYGAVTDVRGERLILRRVKPADVRAIARQYWVKWLYLAT